MESKPIIIIDFDHTLFNAQAFKKDLAKALGLSLVVWQKDYKKNKRIYKNYNYQKQIEKYPLKEQKRFLRVLKNSKKYLYSDAVEFLRQNHESTKKTKSTKIILLSKGQPDFQKLKIKYCGLDELLKIKTVKFSKINFIKTLRPASPKFQRGEQAQGKNNKNIFFINDRGSEIDEIKNKFPQIIAVWIRRKNSEYKNEPCKKFDYKVNNLKINLKKYGGIH